MRKPILFLLLVAALLLPMVAACAAPPPLTTVSFMVSGSQEEFQAYQSLVKSFQADNPDYRIDLRYVPDDGDYRRRLAADFSASTPADVFLLNYRRIAPFAAEGAMAPIGPYLAQSSVIKEADFFQPAIDAFRFQGELWCLAQNVSSLVMYYNKTLFDAAGLDYPSAAWSWDDFVAAARALTVDTNGDGVTDQYGVSIDPNFYRLAPFIWQNGGELVDDMENPTRLAIDSPEAQEAFQWFVDLQVKEKVTPDAAAEAARDGESRFLDGTVGMYFNSRRSTPTMRTIEAFDWDVAPLPAGQQPASVLHVDGYCLAAQTKNKEAAWKFIEYANSPTGQEIVARTGRTVPSLQSVAQSEAFLDPATKPASSQVWLDVVPVLRPVPVYAMWPPIEDAVNKEIERAFYGLATVEEATSAALSITAPMFSRSQ